MFEINQIELFLSIKIDKDPGINVLTTAHLQHPEKTITTDPIQMIAGIDLNLHSVQIVSD
jgi:hypothetical protein